MGVLFSLVVMTGIGILIIGLVLFVISIILGLIAGLIWWLLKRKAHEAYDYRTSNEIQNTKKHGIGSQIFRLLCQPRKIILSGDITLYSRGKCILATMAVSSITALLSYILHYKVGRDIGLVIGILLGLIVISLSLIEVLVIRWFFSRIVSVVFIYIGKIKLSKTEGCSVFNMIFLVLNLLVSIESLVGNNFIKIGLGLILLIWFSYVQYLLLRERYGLGRKVSIMRLMMILLVEGTIIITPILIVILSILSLNNTGVVAIG